MDKSEVDALLTSHGQQHLLRYADSLSESELSELYAELRELDLNKVSKCWSEAQSKLSESSELKDEHLEPLDRSIVGSRTRDKASVPRWEAVGKKSFFSEIDVTAVMRVVCATVCAVLCRTGEDWRE